MNERILNSFSARRVAKTLRSNCEALSGLRASGLPQTASGAAEFLVDSETEEA